MLNGEPEFTLVLLAQCIGLLNRESINDKFLVQYLQGLLALTNPESKHYEAYLNTFVDDTSTREKANIKDVVIRQCLPFSKHHIVS